MEKNQNIYEETNLICEQYQFTYYEQECNLQSTKLSKIILHAVKIYDEFGKGCLDIKQTILKLPLNLKHIDGMENSNNGR